MLWLAACAREPAEQRLRAAVEAGHDAAEAGDADAILELLAEDFSAQSGNFDRRAFGFLLRGQMRRAQNIGVTITHSEFQMFDDRATVKLGLLITASAGGVIPERGQVVSLTTGWRDDGDWKIYSAEWKEGEW